MPLEKNNLQKKMDKVVELVGGGSVILPRLVFSAIMFTWEIQCLPYTGFFCPPTATPCLTFLVPCVFLNKESQYTVYVIQFTAKIKKINYKVGKRVGKVDWQSVWKKLCVRLKSINLFKNLVQNNVSTKICFPLASWKGLTAFFPLSHYPPLPTSAFLVV